MSHACRELGRLALLQVELVERQAETLGGERGDKDRALGSREGKCVAGLRHGQSDRAAVDALDVDQDLHLVLWRGVLARSVLARGVICFGLWRVGLGVLLFAARGFLRLGLLVALGEERRRVVGAEDDNVGGVFGVPT